MTTEPPYTDADLGAEAANQHAGLTEDPDFTSVGEAMCDSYVGSTLSGDKGSTWAQLLPYPEDGGEAYADAQIKIHDLIRKAADVSEWAINLGADGLEPSANVLGMEAGDTPIVRVHMAFHPDMDQAARNEFAMQLGAAMRDIH